MCYERQNMNCAKPRFANKGLTFRVCSMLSMMFQKNVLNVGLVLKAMKIRSNPNMLKE